MKGACIYRASLQSCVSIVQAGRFFLLPSQNKAIIMKAEKFDKKIIIQPKKVINTIAKMTCMFGKFFVSLKWLINTFISFLLTILVSFL